MITVSCESLGLIRGREIGPIINIIRLRNNKEQEPQTEKINSKSFYYLTFMLFSLGLDGISPPPFISALPLSNKTKHVSVHVCSCECVCVRVCTCECVCM